MNPKRKQRLVLILLGVAGVSAAVLLVLFAFKQNVNFFYSPSDIANGLAPVETVVRAGGMVREDSVKRSGDSLEVSFAVTDYANDVSISYNGILPDLFQEGQGVIVIGKLGSNGILSASEVLAKHDESYMPPEVAQALEDAGHSTN